MDPLVIASIGIAGMFVLIAVHVPIGVAMGLAGFVSVAALLGWSPAISLFNIEPTAVLSNTELAVIPLFLLMGSFASSSGLSADIYRLAYVFLGHRRGGLALATIGGCAGFGAVCGSSIATAATMTRVAMPEMLKRGYQPTMASGCIAAGGTLGMLIPPSVIMVLYAVLTEQFIIALFVACIVPGVISVVLYFIAISIQVRLHPEVAPPGPPMIWPARWQVFRESSGVIVLITVVSGGIYSGIFTVTEAAAVGATLAFVLTILRGRLTWPTLWQVLAETAANAGMIYVIIIGARIFTYFVTLSHLPNDLVGAIASADLPPLLIIFFVCLMYLVLGSVFDTIAAMVITLPFVFPLILTLGYDPIWFGVLNVVVIEIGMITPPIGINAFVLHGMAPNIPLKTIFRGILPFFYADMVRLALLVFFPGLALWLPRILEVPM